MSQPFVSPEEKVALSAIAALGTTNPFGRTTFPLPIPSDPALLGSVPCAQAFVLDPNGPWSGFSISGGISLGIGW